MSIPKPVMGLGLAAAMALATPFIAGWEGFSKDPYKDIVGVQTVCYGETNVQMRRYTDAECKAMLQASVKVYANGVLTVNPQLANHPAQLAAATSLAYNIGLPKYKKSTVARKFSAGDFKGACEAIKMWKYAGGKVVKGLVNRRQAEYTLCMTYV